MGDKSYRALWVSKTEAGSFEQAIADRPISGLPEGDVLVRVRYSSLNFKDMISATGRPGVTRNYPHQPGIDAAGEVEESSSPAFKPGDQVIVCGYDLGMNTFGGLGQYIRVPAGWVVSMPQGLDAREAMSYGTAGFTAALCIEKLLQMGTSPADGDVAITGATGGVGTFAIALLAKLGFNVAAVTGKLETAPHLNALGAHQIVDRNLLLESKRPLEKPRFGHGIDTLGGEYLANLLKLVNYGGSVAACGLAASADLPTTVLPFILRNVNLLGVDCVEQPLARKVTNWQKLGGEWKLDNLDALAEEITLAQVPECLDRMARGQVVGRYLVNLDR
ncbi:MAG: oxidoreductase [Porticoccaceae bacterium]